MIVEVEICTMADQLAAVVVVLIRLVGVKASRHVGLEVCHHVVVNDSLLAAVVIMHLAAVVDMLLEEEAVVDMLLEEEAVVAQFLHAVEDAT